ncbi:hypothetical protein QW180_19915 [Vibrio sinaloensis]|nr:hypothetical protein [Vibrio sinaloensis]
MLMALYDIKYTDIPEFYDESKLVQVESVLREHGFCRKKVVESFQQVNFEVSPNAPSEQMVSMQKPTASGKTKTTLDLLEPRPYSIFVFRRRLFGFEDHELLYPRAISRASYQSSYRYCECVSIANERSFAADRYSVPKSYNSKGR